MFFRYVTHTMEIYLVNMSGEIVAKWDVQFAIMPDVVVWEDTAFQAEPVESDGKVIFREIIFHRLIDGMPSTKIIGTVDRSPRTDYL